MRLGRRRVRRARDARHGGGLRGDRPERGRVPHLVPTIGLQRGAPTQLADRCAGVGDPRERPQVVTPDAPEPPLSDGHDSLHVRGPYDGHGRGRAIERKVNSARTRAATGRKRGGCRNCHHAGITLLRRGCSELSGHCPQAGSPPQGDDDRRIARRMAVDGSRRRTRAPRRRPRCPVRHPTSRRSTRPSRRSARSRAPWPRRSSRPPSSTTSTTPRSRTCRTRRPRSSRSPPASSTRGRPSRSTSGSSRAMRWRRTCTAPPRPGSPPTSPRRRR